MQLHNVYDSGRVRLIAIRCNRTSGLLRVLQMAVASCNIIAILISSEPRSSRLVSENNDIMMKITVMSY